MVKSRVSYINRGATVAWGPTSETASLVAAGTVAGAISDSFDASSTLELFSLDLGSGSGEMPSLGAVQLPERFHALAWGVGSDPTAHPHGLLAGGMVDGTVKVFNPNAIAGCAPEPNSNARERLQREEGGGWQAQALSQAQAHRLTGSQALRLSDAACVCACLWCVQKRWGHAGG